MALVQVRPCAMTIPTTPSATMINRKRALRSISCAIISKTVAGASRIRQIPRQGFQHRHADGNAHFDLFADQRLRAVGNDGVDLDTAVHRTGMHHQRAFSPCNAEFLRRRKTGRSGAGRWARAWPVQAITRLSFLIPRTSPGK